MKSGIKYDALYVNRNLTMVETYFWRNELSQIVSSSAVNTNTICCTARRRETITRGRLNKQINFPVVNVDFCFMRLKSIARITVVEYIYVFFSQRWECVYTRLCTRAMFRGVCRLELIVHNSGRAEYRCYNTIFYYTWLRPWRSAWNRHANNVIRLTVRVENNPLKLREIVRKPKRRICVYDARGFTLWRDRGNVVERLTLYIQVYVMSYRSWFRPGFSIHRLRNGLKTRNENPRVVSDVHNVINR